MKKVFTLTEVFHQLYKSRKNAFTLTEVLITLGIIGVVAAIIISSLIVNHQKRSTVTKLKAFYSMFSQVVRQSVVDNGDASTWDKDMETDDFTAKYILPYIEGVAVLTSGYSMNALSNSYYIYWYRTTYTPAKHYELKNGISFTIQKRIGSKPISFMIVVDINGKSKPNILGKDGFVFYIDTAKNGILPVGFNNKRNILKTDPNSGCSKKNDWMNIHYGGEYCAALIMNDGWQILEDYPW